MPSPSFSRIVCLLGALGLPLPALAAGIGFDAAQSAITIEGSIANGDDAKFAALLDHRPRNLVIRSDGGRQVPAIAIARAVRAQAMTVIVDGFCASACAQIIFPAGAERRIRPESFVAFHGGNLAALQAVREAVAHDAAALQAPDGPASAADDEARRASVAQALATYEARLDTIDAEQAAFDADMRLAPAVVDFYLRLTALRDIRVELHPGDPQPVRVAVGRRGICDWWVPDRDGLAQLGLTLRNRYDVPTPATVAAMSRSTPERLYFGPPLAVDDPKIETLCPPP